MKELQTVLPHVGRQLTIIIFLVVGASVSIWLTGCSNEPVEFASDDILNPILQDESAPSPYEEQNVINPQALGEIKNSEAPHADQPAAAPGLWPWPIRPSPIIKFMNDRDRDGIDDLYELTLARSFAPFMILARGEKHRPTNVDSYLANCQLAYFHGRPDRDQFGRPLPLGAPFCDYHTVIEAGRVNQTNLVNATHYQNGYELDNQRGFSASTIRNNNPRGFAGSVLPSLNDKCRDIPIGPPQHSRTSPRFTLLPRARHGSLNPADWTVYFRVRKSRLPETAGGYDLQYWFFYAYNDAPGLSNTGFLGGIANHAGDWERVTVSVTADLKFHSVYMARHKGGERYELEDGELEFFDNNRQHVKVYSALGTHGSYPRSGRWPLSWWIFHEIATDETSDGEPWQTWENLINLGEGVTPMNNQHFLFFAGRWGEVGGTSEGGPFGPKFKEAWDSF